MRLPYRRYRALLLLLCALMIISGCKAAKRTDDLTPPPASIASPAPTALPLQVKLYYGDEQGEQLVEKDAVLTIPAEQNKYIAVLNALAQSPDDQSVALFKGFTFFSAKLDGGNLTIDLTFPEQSRWGSNGEELLIEALRKTMFQFTEVDTIEVLLNGEQVESLMGHVDLPHPMRRSD